MDSIPLQILRKTRSGKMFAFCSDIPSVCTYSMRALVHACVCIFMCACVFTCTCMCVCVFTSVCVCIYVCARVLTCGWMRVCMCI